MVQATRVLTPAQPIPLLFLATTFDRGGAEKILARYAIGLPREKYAVHAAALQGRSRAIADGLARAGIPTHDLGMAWKGDLRILGRLARLLRQERIRILFTFMFHPTLIGRLVGWLSCVPVRISSEHTMAAEGLGRRLLNRWTVGLATHVVAVSDRVAAYAAREFRIPADRLTTIREWRGLGPLSTAPATRPGRGSCDRMQCAAPQGERSCDASTRLRTGKQAPGRGRTPPPGPRPGGGAAEGAGA